MINAFRLLADGELAEGIEINLDSKRVPYVRVKTILVRVVREPTTPLPRIDKTRLLEARPCTDAEKIHAFGPRLIHRGDWKGALLFIDVATLRFNEKNCTQLPVENAWPGAETYRFPFVQRGTKSTTDRVQLLALEDGEQAVVADCNYKIDGKAHYRTFTWKSGTMIGSPATSLELAKVLAHRALSLTRVGALGWTKHTLCELGHASLWTDDLQKKLSTAANP